MMLFAIIAVCIAGWVSAVTAGINLQKSIATDKRRGWAILRLATSTAPWLLLVYLTHG